MHLPTPKLPSAARNRRSGESANKSTTASVRGTVLSSLLTQHIDEFEDTCESLDGSSSGKESVLSSHVVRNYKSYFEVVARRPGAVSLGVESARQGEPPVLIITKVNDEGCLGPTALDPGGSVVGLALVGLSRTPLSVESPERPTSLRSVLDALNGEPKNFPLYLHLCLKEHLMIPVRICLRLHRVLVSTNRRPILQEAPENGCTFANTIVDRLEPSSLDSSQKGSHHDDHLVVWGLATIAYQEDNFDNEHPMRHVEPDDAESNANTSIGVNRQGSAASRDEESPRHAESRAVGIEQYQFIGWEPLRREQVKGILRGRKALVYVHGFNTNLQYASRSAALYADNMVDADSVSICFCWPSNPPLPKTWAISAVLSVAERNYTAAEQSLQRSVPALLYTATALSEAGPARLFWKCHSMGCYLTLSVMDRFLQRDPKLTRVSSIFSKIILDAPDAPTWFFIDVLRRATSRDIRFLHLFNPLDEAVEIARQRRGLDFPAPGNGAVIDVNGAQVIDCSLCRASMGRHDYGRVDRGCLEEQRLFIAGIPPEQRGLDVISQTPRVWQLPYSSGSGGGSTTPISRSRSARGAVGPRKPYPKSEVRAIPLPPAPPITAKASIDGFREHGDDDAFSEKGCKEAEEDKSFSEKGNAIAADEGDATPSTVQAPPNTMTPPVTENDASTTSLNENDNMNTIATTLTSSSALAVSDEEENGNEAGTVVSSDANSEEVH